MNKAEQTEMREAYKEIGLPCPLDRKPSDKLLSLDTGHAQLHNVSEEDYPRVIEELRQWFENDTQQRGSFDPADITHVTFRKSLTPKERATAMEKLRQWFTDRAKCLEEPTS